MVKFVEVGTMGGGLAFSAKRLVNEREDLLSWKSACRTNDLESLLPSHGQNRKLALLGDFRARHSSS
jgi:hypothetical protein